MERTVIMGCRKIFVTRKIKWTFTPPYAPWQGGVYESLVGSVKRAMRPTVGKRILILDDFNTLIIEIEGVINMRPLIYIHSEREEM